MSVKRVGLLAFALAVQCTEHEPHIATVRSAATWESAVPPARIRVDHTATLLGTGEILVAGGGSAPRTTEILAPFASRSVPGPDLTTPRARHTATMLLSGKVLLAGGDDAGTAEIYDPLTRTTAATAPMRKTRRGHVAIRLRGGRVLVLGGAGDFSTPDTTNEIFDPDRGVWEDAPPRRGGWPAAAATLANGRVLVVSREATATEIYDPSAIDVAAPWSTPGGQFPEAFNTRTLTRLDDGRVFSGYTVSCVSTGGPPMCSAFTGLFAPASGTVSGGPSFRFTRSDFAAVRTIDGRVLVMGGTPTESVRAAERFDRTQPGTMADDGDLSAGHVSTTATIVPGGDIVVLGGAQAAIDRRVELGSWSISPIGLGEAREGLAGARLHDGKVLFTGGLAFVAGGSTTSRRAEIVSPLDASPLARVGDLNEARAFHTMTTLRSGRVLVAGGGTRTAELFDPATRTFALVGAMAVDRSAHSATRLASGDVLVLGGDAEGTAEIFDVATATFTAIGKSRVNRTRHGAVLLPNGKVLVVGGDSAEIFDPDTRTFRLTTPPGAAREGRTARLLPNGNVFVAGGATASPDLYDFRTETWSFAGPVPLQFAEVEWASLPDGRLVGSGGRFPVLQTTSLSYVFDPIVHPTGTFHATAGSPNYYRHAVALAGSGDVVSAGGEPCYGNCQPQSTAQIRLFRDRALGAFRPAVTDAPATVTGGARVTIRGTGFANGAEASDGTTGSSAVNHPLAHWVSDAGDAVVNGTVADFTDTTLTWLVPATALHGHGLLFVSVAGVMSRGRSVTIEPAQQAAGCRFDAECGSGFCVDGVCCDRRCDGLCEGCSKARKIRGEDGVCGEVPPGRDIAGRCVRRLGEPCASKEECGPNFCAQGVCCDSSCEGQCLACNLAGRVGRCSGINEGACGAICDGDHTLKQVGAPDVDCAPFKCAGPRCNTTCASVRDCVAPAVCDLAGQCVPPVAASPGDDVVCGCRAAGGKTSKKSLLALAVLATIGGWRRRRRPS